jgi:hypothetical protein
MFRAVQMNSSSIWMKLAFQTGKIARQEKLWCYTGTMRGQTKNDTSRNILKTEPYLRDCLCFRCWKMAQPWHYYITRFSLGPRAAEKARCMLRNGTDLITKSNVKPYINAEMFLDCVQTVFLPNFAELWRLDEFAEEMSVLLMENCPSQITCIVMWSIFSPRHECTSSLLHHAPHTTQMFQVLDLTVFRVLKRHTRYELPFGNEKAIVQLIMKVYHDFEQTMV